MDKTRVDFIRAKVEELKAFDIVHELRMINDEASMGVPDVVPLDMVVEKLKPAFEVLATAIEGLLNEAISLASRLGDTEEPTVGLTEEGGWRNEEYYTPQLVGYDGNGGEIYSWPPTR